MRYYSQFKQDQIISRTFFPNKTDGVFVEIGADDGIEKSNSKHFEDLGWTGLCIEPRPKAFAKLIQNRSCACENYGVFDKELVLDFLAIEGYGKGLSGIVDCHTTGHKRAIKQELRRPEAKTSTQEVIKVQCKTLAHLLALHDITHVDYCSIDTEGSEVQILRSANWNKTSISVLTIENKYKDKAIRDFMASQGYKLHSRIEIDDVFIHQDFS